MSLLKQTFEQLKIAEKNNAKTKPSLIPVSDRMRPCHKQKSVLLQNDRYRKYFWVPVGEVYRKKLVEDRECHISTGINLKSKIYGQRCDDHLV